MFGKFVAGLVMTYLGKYFENVNEEQVKVSLWNGHVQLRNLRFRKDVLRTWDTAICVKEGLIDELTILIPWRRLHSECVVVTVKKIQVVLQQKIAAGYDPEREQQEAYERKMHKLNIFEAILKQEYLKEAQKKNAHTSSTDHNILHTGDTKEMEVPVKTRKDAAFLARLKAVILNNIQLIINDMLVLYEGCQTSKISTRSGKEPCLTHDYKTVLIMLSHLKTHGCDENNNPHFTVASEHVLYKMVNLEGVQVLLNSTSASKQEDTEDVGNCVDTSLTVDEVLVDKSQSLSEHMMNSLPRRLRSVSCHQVISPFSILARVQYQPLPYRADLPMVHIDVQIDSLLATLSREQRVILGALWREVCDGETYDMLLRFRPVGVGKERPTDNPRAWWVYAITATLYRIQRRRERHVFVWETYKRLKESREEYMMLFKRARREALGAIWLFPLTEAETLRLRELEIELPIESIKLARRLAYHRMHMEREHRDEVLEKRRNQQLILQQKENNNNSLDNVPDACTMDPGSSVETGRGGWWSWVAFARLWNTPIAVCDPVAEDGSDILEMDDMFKLTHTDQWTEAQRLAVAKEFGIREHEVENLQNDAGDSKRALGEVQWEISLCVRSLGLTLCKSNKAETPFATFSVEKISSNLTCFFNRCFSFALYADDYLVLSHLEKQSRVVSVVRAAKERYVVVDGKTEAAVSLLLNRLCADSFAEYDARSATVPFEIRLRWNHVDCNVNIPFFQACIDFARSSPSSVSASFVSSSSVQISERSSLLSVSNAQQTGEAQGWKLDRRTQRAALMMTVEREFLCDWQMLFSEVRVLAAEDEQRAIRVTLNCVEVKNDPVKKKNKLERIQNPSENFAVFGDDCDDWVNTVYATVEAATVECMMIQAQSGSVADVADDFAEELWDRIATLPRLTLCFKKSVIMHRSPFVPFLSVSLVMEQSPRFHFARQSLSLFCTTFTLMTHLLPELLQQTSVTPTATREISLTNTDATTASWEFLAQVHTVDERYLVEHESLPKSLQEQFYRSKMHMYDVTEVYRRIKVMMGMMIVYHARRPYLPSHFFELHHEHLHIVQDFTDVSVFVECGGVTHDCRSGVLHAKRLLFEKYKFPSLESMTLFEAFIEEWCKKQKDGVEAEEEVREAFRIVHTASRTNPCRHIRLRCKSVEEAQCLVKALETNAATYHVIHSPFDTVDIQEEEEEEANEKEQQPCLFTLNITAPGCTFLLHDEAIRRVDQCLVPPTHEVTMTAVNFLYMQQKKEMVVSIAASSLCVIAHGRSTPVIKVSELDATSPAMNAVFRLKQRPYPNMAWKCTKVDILKGIQVDLSSELLFVVEMLWDLMGILSNQIFGHVVYRSVPWNSEPAAVVEEKWRADPAGGLLQHNVILINMDYLLLSLYYPSDAFELAKGATVSAFLPSSFSSSVDNTDETVNNVEQDPVAVIEGSQVSVRWSSTEGCSETCCVLQRPQVKMRQFSSGELCRIVEPAEKDSAAETSGVSSTCRPSASLSFSIHRGPPMLSTSDFIANGGPAGYRYTHFFALSGGHLDVLYWQPQLWDIIELLTRGVVSRTTFLTWRQPYIAGGSLLSWPQPEAPFAPFSWCLLHKSIELCHVRLTLPHENILKSVQLWGKVDFLCFQDKLVPSKEPHSRCDEYVVKHTSTTTLEGLEVMGLRQKKNTTASGVGTRVLLRPTSVKFDFTYELFRAGGWPNGRLRSFCIQMPEDVIFQGTSNQLALLIDWMYANYMETAWKGHFVPVKVAVDPFIETCGGRDESTAWIVNVRYMCFRLKDPPQSYCCVENGTSFATFERTSIDIAVVMERLMAEFHWRANGAYSSRHVLGEASVWHFDQNFRDRVVFDRHPSEAVHESLRFFWLHHNGNSVTLPPTEEQDEKDEEEPSETNGYAEGRVAFRATYSVAFHNGEKAFSSNIMVNCIDITPVPYFLYNLKDSLFSLRFRNALGRILRWEPRVPGLLQEPPSPKSQNFSTDYRLLIRLVNLRLSRLLRLRQRAEALFFASIMATEFVSSSGKYGVGCEWSISVDSIVDNGVVVSDEAVVGEQKLRPLLVRQFWPQRTESVEKIKKLFYLEKTVTNGLVGTVSSLWIVLPLKKEIYVLREALEKDGYKQLYWLGTFLEERWAWRNGTLRSYEHSPSPPIHFTIETPCIVVAEHGSVVAGSPNHGRGVVCSLGDISLKKAANGDEKFCVSFSAVSIKSLQENSHYVMQPMELVISGHSQSDGTREVRVRVDALTVQVEQSLYELMLQSIVRHFVATEAEFLEAMCAEGKEPVYCSYLPMGDITTGKANNAPFPEEGEDDLRIYLEWASFTMRVVRDDVGFFFAAGKMSALYNVSTVKEFSRDSTTSVRWIRASLDFVTLGVDDRPRLFDLQPVRCASPTLIEKNKEDETLNELSTKPHLSFSLYAKNKTEEEIYINFGKAVVFLEEDTMQLLFSTLYEPYRRIVLPEYQVHKIKYIDGDTTLQEQLVLSKRTKVRVVRGKYNHITIDGNNNNIHFFDAGSPLLSLDEGLTLCIINARIHLYGKPIEYYMAVGNGSYIIVDTSCNTNMYDLHNPFGNIGRAKSFPEHSTSISEFDKEEGGEQFVCRSQQDGDDYNETDRDPVQPTELPSPIDLTRRVFANVILMLTLPEGTNELRPTHLGRRSQNAHFSRSLVLLATMSVQMETVCCDGYVTDSKIFNLSEFALRCEYLDTAGSVMDTRSLVSEWALTVHHTQSCPQPRRPLERHIEVTCSRGIEVCLRYSDVSLCWRAFLRARQALGYIETNVLDDVVNNEEFSSLETPQYPSEESSKKEEFGDITNFSFRLKYLSVDVVDDSTNVDVPLFRAHIQNLTFPTAIKNGLALKLHISCTWSIIYYDFTSSSWRPLLESVLLDIVLRRKPNVSLEDVKQRKGLLRAGLHFRAVRIHFSVRVVENMRRLWLLKERLGDTRLFFEQTANLKQPGTSKQEFFVYKLTQHVGCDLKISFIHNNCNNFRQPVVLSVHEPLQINFPRVEGHELPVSEHSVEVSLQNDTKLVNISKTGKILLPLGPGVLCSHVLVDITVSNGQKVVDFRTNVAFKNDLPFAMDIGGVGIIQPGEVLHIPVDALRRRTSFIPLTTRRCSGVCSLGVSYDMLPCFYKQFFLGVCKIDYGQETEVVSPTCTSRSLEEAVFFCIHFGAESRIGKSNVVDCMGTFEAPFFIVNAMSLPIRVGLMYRRKSGKKNFLLKFSDSRSYDYVTTLDIAPEERCSITQVSPLMDIYIDISVNQANGEPMSQETDHMGTTRFPALVHSASKRECDHTITLNDQFGSSMILHIDYTSRAVTIWCPYWFVNRTPYYLQIADVRKKRQVAGLRSDEGIPPDDGSGSAYLVNTDRMEKLGDKAVVFLCIARRPSLGEELQWTKWSDQVPVGALREFGVIHCAVTKHVNMSLSYTVEFVGSRMGATRVVTFSPRWIFENHTDNIIAFRQYQIRKEKEIRSLLRPVEVGPDQSQIIDLNREGATENVIQVRLPANREDGNQSCYWSQPLDIDKLGDKDFNLHFETRIKVQDRTCVHPDDTIVEINEDLYITRAGSAVLMISCYRRGSTMYAVVSTRKQPPYVVENRTMYTAYVKQRDVSQLMTIYPRSTRGFAWEDSKLQPVMELWASEGLPTTRSRSVFINFDPRAVLKLSEQLQQELHLPGGVVLFVRVRGLGRTSYAISITTENTIDVFCSLPYFQFLFQVEVDSIYALFSDDREDFSLLTVKPAKLIFSQRAVADGDGDEQVFSFSLSVIQIDDERMCAKQRVVAQLVDAKPLTIQFTRQLFRTTPIVYFKDFVINLSPSEVHLEDSFIFEAMKYVERIRTALGSDTVVASWTRTKNSLETTNILSSKHKPRAEDAWKQHVIFIDRLLIEQFMVSISLYRSPGAQNDPMWERMGYLSLFIRSVQDARLVWRRIEQYGVHETLWLIGTFYSSYYKQQLQQQMSNVVHVAGLDMMRGFVTDLLQSYFLFTFATNIDRSKVRMGRRAEAHFIPDEQSLTDMEMTKVNHNSHVDQWLPGDKEPVSIPEAANSGFTGVQGKRARNLSMDPFWARLSTVKRENIIEAASRLPWSAFYARVTDSELREFGFFAVQRFLRTLDFSSSSSMEWQLQDLACGEGSRNNGDNAPMDIGPCERCDQIEKMYMQSLESDSLGVLPHPKTGIITWAEFVHHVSWSEFVRICTPSEVRQHAGIVLRSLVGQPMNMFRIESIGEWNVDA